MSILDKFRGTLNKGGHAIKNGASAMAKNPIDTLSVAQGAAGLVGSILNKKKKVKPKVNVADTSAATNLENKAKANYARENEYAKQMAERSNSTMLRQVQNASGGNALDKLNKSSQAMGQGNATYAQLQNSAANRLLQAQTQANGMKQQVNQANVNAENQANNFEANTQFANQNRQHNTDSMRMTSSIKNLLLNKELKNQKKAKDEANALKKKPIG